jgi:hypothetical protein
VVRRKENIQMNNDIQTDSDKAVGSGALLGWLRVKLNEAESALKAREQMEASWRGGTDASWRAVGCKLNKLARLNESATHGRIAVKCRREVEMFKAVIASIGQPNVES